MKLYLNNVGIVKDSEVKLEGLTVITGKNSSGKTTVGKTIYSLISAGNNTVEAFDESRRSYICSQLNNIESLMLLLSLPAVSVQHLKQEVTLHGTPLRMLLLWVIHFIFPLCFVPIQVRFLIKRLLFCALWKEFRKSLFVCSKHWA